MKSMNIQTIALLCLAGLVLSGCKNPFIDRIMNKADMDEEDFGPGAVIQAYDVGSTAELNSRISGLPTDGNIIFNITRDIDAGSVLHVTSPINLKISIRGHAITYPSANNWIIIPSGKTVILRSPLKGTGANANALVAVTGGNLIMRDGGSISGNTCTASSEGGGVWVSSGTFTMYGGTISGNTSDNNGGGVFVDGAFTMYGGTISGNTAGDNGGGVVVSAGSFTMYGGTIKGNSVNGGGDQGGGVFVAPGRTFIKTGGFIYGNDAGGNSNRTAGGPGSGHAAYSDIIHYFDYTLKPRVSGFVRWP